VRPLRGWQQLEPIGIQPADGGQVDRAESGEPTAQQVMERLAENREDGDAQ
jgi:hypothetical protein